MYEGSYLKIDDGVVGGGDDAKTFAKLFGLKDVEDIHIKSSDYAVDKDDISEFLIGHREVTYNGETREIIVLSVRGTNGTFEEWSSNFDVEQIPMNTIK